MNARLRTSFPGESGWCEVYAPGVYRATVAHIEDVRWAREDAFPCTEDLAKYTGKRVRLVWGMLFRGALDGVWVTPEVVIGMDLTPREP